MSDSDVKEPAIRELAHELWQRSGCPTGEEDHFWYEAERTLKAAKARADSENSETANDDQRAGGVSPRTI